LVGFTLDKQTTDLATGAISVGVGFTAWMWTATRNEKNLPLFGKQRLTDAIGNIVGPNLAKQITGTPMSAGGQAKFNMTGFLNKVFFGGIVLKVANAFSRKYTEKLIDSVPDFIDAAANGLIAGGLVGGIFDPPGYTATSSGGWINVGNTPTPRGAEYSNRISVLV
jgi:hypothetical protein